MNTSFGKQFLQRHCLLLTGIILLFLTILLRFISEADTFSLYGKPFRLSFSAIVILIAASILFLSQMIVLPFQKKGSDFFLILCIGLLLRGILFHHMPILENDYYRYLHDGAMTAHLQNPYQYSPQQIAQERPETVSFIYDNQIAMHTNSQINHPHLRTIYPPVAQLVFAIGYCLTPYALDGLRLIYLLFDIANVVFILLLLRQFKLPWGFVVFYLWNPILLFEVYLRCHYDLIVGTFLLFFSWAIITKRYKIAVVALTLAIGAKLWPIILLPFAFYPLRKQFKKLAICGGLFLGLLFCILTPQLLSIAFSNNSGVFAYAKEWIANEWAYHLCHYIGEQLHRCFYNIDARLLARGLIVALLVTVALYKAARSKNYPRMKCESICVVISLMLLLSPTFYGWYYLALLPLATVTGRPAFLFWTLLIPLSYIDVQYMPKWLSMLCLHLPLWIMVLTHFTPWQIKVPWMMKKAPNQIV